jgi:hypothetical protein
MAIRGPHPVGLRSFVMDDPQNAGRELPVDVWYPAILPAERLDQPYDAEHPLSLPHAAHRDLPAAPGRYPLVLFSHGNSGYRRQSTFLTTHLASWGAVVAAPDHAGNTFPEMMSVRDEDERKRIHFAARRNRPSDILAVADRVLADNRGWAGIDPDRMGVLGHSFGGWTAAKMPGRDRRVRAVCGMAPASEPFVGRKAFAPGELPFSPSLPVLLVAALDDVLVNLEKSVRPLFERMAPPSALVGIHRSDHFHFCDGIPLLHGLHEKNVRPKQAEQARPLDELLDEERMHRLLCGLVASFMFEALAPGGADPTLALDAAQLRELDPALERLG